VALIRVATSLIRPVRLPVIPVNKESGDYLKYLVFVVREGRKIGLKYPISLLFSLLPASGPLGDRFSETASATTESWQTHPVSRVKNPRSARKIRFPKLDDGSGWTETAAT
jgi:hypothetical protein